MFHVVIIKGKWMGIYKDGILQVEGRPEHLDLSDVENPTVYEMRHIDAIHFGFVTLPHRLEKLPRDLLTPSKLEFVLND